MEKWELALQVFLKKWENNKEVIGALVCGSYITGNPSQHSDIDIHILLDSKTTWRERGNEIIDGILIEYFANPVRSHYEYMENDYKERMKSNAHMFCTGKILFDKTGELDALIKDSREYLVKEFPEQSKIGIEIAKYQLWDRLDNLEEVFDAEGDEFFFVFYNDLNALFETYGKFLQFDSIPVHKLKRLLVNEEDKTKYHVSDFPDEVFLRMFVNALFHKDKLTMMKEYQELTNHVLEKMGGFNIDGWKIRSSAP
ncbi:MAG: nucleotidyltransferase domain-containing protein [Spirochaetales bacterium]|nr:nucleotidyltransferase domain-containing protein [Spirochaetales bacterium]